MPLLTELQAERWYDMREVDAEPAPPKEEIYYAQRKTLDEKFDAYVEALTKMTFDVITKQWDAQTDTFSYRRWPDASRKWSQDNKTWEWADETGRFFRSVRVTAFYIHGDWQEVACSAELQYINDQEENEYRTKKRLTRDRDKALQQLGPDVFGTE